MSKSSNQNSEDVLLEDIRKVFGVILYMGIFKLPNRRMYKQNRTQVSFIVDCMPFNVFNQMFSLLHFKDNNLIPDRATPEHNRCYKIQPILNYTREQF